MNSFGCWVIQRAFARPCVEFPCHRCWSTDSLSSRGIAACILWLAGTFCSDLADLSEARAASTVVVSGDPIGPDSTHTDNTGGFTAVRTSDVDLGQPAIFVSLDGDQFLSELRVIVFGVPAPNGSLLFDDFDYQLEFWTSEGYFAGAPSRYALRLGDAENVDLVHVGPNAVVPEFPFGTAGPLAGNANTYDLRFDLMPLLIEAHDQTQFQAPMAAGDWVLGFQSRHEIANSGTLRVAGSSATEGPLPLFSRGNLIPRGILGGQDPENITLRWGISLTTVDALPGDLDADHSIDANDVAIWTAAFGTDVAADVDGDGDSDGADFLSLQRALGTGINILPADLDQDGDIDGDDLDRWIAAFGDNQGGDIDWDLDTDGADFLLWQRRTNQQASKPYAYWIPEPNSSILGLIGMAISAVMARFVQL